MAVFRQPFPPANDHLLRYRMVLAKRHVAKQPLRAALCRSMLQVPLEFPAPQRHVQLDVDDAILARPCQLRAAKSAIGCADRLERLREQRLHRPQQTFLQRLVAPIQHCGVVTGPTQRYPLAVDHLCPDYLGENAHLRPVETHYQRRFFHPLPLWKSHGKGPCTASQMGRRSLAVNPQVRLIASLANPCRCSASTPPNPQRLTQTIRRATDSFLRGGLTRTTYAQSQLLRAGRLRFQER
jgi:hypothetical protein